MHKKTKKELAEEAAVRDRVERMRDLGRRRQALLRKKLGEKKYRERQRKLGSEGGKKNWQ